MAIKLMDLPTEILKHILGFVGVWNLYTLGPVNKLLTILIREVLIDIHKLGYHNWLDIYSELIVTPAYKVNCFNPLIYKNPDIILRSDKLETKTKLNMLDFYINHQKVPEITTTMQYYLKFYSNRHEVHRIKIKYILEKYDGDPVDKLRLILDQNKFKPRVMMYFFEVMLRNLELFLEEIPEVLLHCPGLSMFDEYIKSMESSITLSLVKHVMNVKQEVILSTDYIRFLNMLVNMNIQEKDKLELLKSVPQAYNVYLKNLESEKNDTDYEIRSGENTKGIIFLYANKEQKDKIFEYIFNNYFLNYVGNWRDKNSLEFVFKHNYKFRLKFFVKLRSYIINGEYDFCYRKIEGFFKSGVKDSMLFKSQDVLFVATVILDYISLKFKNYANEYFCDTDMSLIFKQLSEYDLINLINEIIIYSSVQQDTYLEDTFKLGYILHHAPAHLITRRVYTYIIEFINNCQLLKYSHRDDILKSNIIEMLAEADYSNIKNYHISSILSVLESLENNELIKQVGFFIEKILKYCDYKEKCNIISKIIDVVIEKTKVCDNYIITRILKDNINIVKKLPTNDKILICNYTLSAEKIIDSLYAKQEMFLGLFTNYNPDKVLIEDEYKLDIFPIRDRPQ